jgi:hypothetical protein
MSKGPGDPVCIFPTFAPDFFGFFKFQTGKNPAKKFSRLKRSGRTNFRAENFCRKNFRTVRVGRDRPDPFQKVCGISIVRPATNGDFSRFRGDLFEILGRESSYSAKISGTKPFMRQKGSRKKGV